MTTLTSFVLPLADQLPIDAPSILSEWIDAIGGELNALVYLAAGIPLSVWALRSVINWVRDLLESGGGGGHSQSYSSSEPRHRS